MAETRTITGIPGIRPSAWGTTPAHGGVQRISDAGMVVRGGAPYQQAGLHAAALAGRVPGGPGPNADPIIRAADAFSQAPRGGVSLENLSKLLATLSMQGARRQGITDITAQESGSGFSPIQRHVRDWGPEPRLAQEKGLRAADIAKEATVDTLYQKAGGGRGTQGFGLGRRGPGEMSQREGEQDHARALVRKLLEGRSVNRGDPADVLRRYGGGLRRG